MREVKNSFPVALQGGKAPSTAAMQESDHAAIQESDHAAIQAFSTGGVEDPVEASPVVPI